MDWWRSASPVRVNRRSSSEVTLMETSMWSGGKYSFALSAHSMTHRPSPKRYSSSPERLYVVERVEAVEVHVIDGQRGLVFVHQHESRAAGVFVGVQPPEQALGERGLSGAQSSGEQENVPGRGVRADDSTQFAGGFG